MQITCNKENECRTSAPPVGGRTLFCTSYLFRIVLTVLRLVHRDAPSYILRRVEFPDCAAIERGCIGVGAEESKIFEHYFRLAGTHVVLDYLGHRRRRWYLRYAARLERLAERALEVTPERDDNRRIRVSDEWLASHHDILHIH